MYVGRKEDATVNRSPFAFRPRNPEVVRHVSERYSNKHQRLTAPITETAKVELRSTDESGHLLTPRAAATRNAGTEMTMLLQVTEEALGTSRSRWRFASSLSRFRASSWGARGEGGGSDVRYNTCPRRASLSGLRGRKPTEVVRVNGTRKSGRGGGRATRARCPFPSCKQKPG